MGRSYAPLMTTIWSDEDFVSLSPEAQRTYLLALSQPNITYCGIVPFTARRWARMAAGTTPEDIDQAVKELEAAGFVVLDEDTEELWVRSFVRHNGVLSQPQLTKAMVRSFDDILSATLRDRFLTELPSDLPKAAQGLAEAQAEAIGQGAGDPAVRLPGASGLQTDDPDLDTNLDPNLDDDLAGSVSSSSDFKPVWFAYANLVAEGYEEPPSNLGAFVRKVAKKAEGERRTRLLEYVRIAPDASTETLAQWLYDDIDPLFIDRPELDPDAIPATDLRCIS